MYSHRPFDNGKMSLSLTFRPRNVEKTKARLVPKRRCQRDRIESPGESGFLAYHKQQRQLQFQGPVSRKARKRFGLKGKF